MDISRDFPIWDKLTAEEQNRLANGAKLQKVNQGTLIHDGTVDCLGLLLVRSGQLRIYSLSEEGREITLYRLFAGDMCLFSAACMLKGIQFTITVEADKESIFWRIPPNLYKEVMGRSAALANYTNELMASRFSEVMWLMEQVMWKSMDQRLAAFLLEECALEKSSSLRITHEKIARHIGTAREVITRLLRYFQREGMVKLTRGALEIVDERKLSALCGDHKSRD